MKIATLNDLSMIESIFAPYRKAYFPHIRQDYLKRKIEANNVILQDGVVIVFANKVPLTVKPEDEIAAINMGLSKYN